MQGTLEVERVKAFHQIEIKIKIKTKRVEANQRKNFSQLGYQKNHLESPNNEEVSSRNW